MINIFQPSSGDTVTLYAGSELARLLTTLASEPVAINSKSEAEIRLRVAMEVDPILEAGEIAIKSEDSVARLGGGDAAALLHAVYTFCEKLGCVFDFSGENLPPRRSLLKFPTLNLRHRPTVRERGIRMHLNFVQDQSFFSEPEFAAFIDNMARQRFNYLAFHMYTPQQWFPFSYRGVKPLDHSLGNLRRKPLAADMIGRRKVKVKEHWFPREFEAITDPEALREAVYSRYKKMMARAHARGIRNSVSIEPESMPPALAEKLPEWTSGEASALAGSGDLTKTWQEEWSGVKLAEPNLRHPLVIDIAVERVLQGIDAFPDLDEVQLMSREGVAWRPEKGETIEAEVARLTEKFGLPPEAFDREALGHVVTPEPGPEMNPKAHPYWTVLPGDCFYPTVIGTLRFVEFSLAILSDERVRRKIAERHLETSIAVYSPNPETIRLMMPGVARMLPCGSRFHCLADYGARDIANNLPAWKPVAEAGHRIGVISWLEFDGTMMLAQGWTDSLIENIKRASEMGVETLYFNHWRVRGLEHNAAAAAALCWDVGQEPDVFYADYFGRLFGTAASVQAITAYRRLEEATLYAKTNNYNIGFTGDWVIQNSTEAPGYYWRRLNRSRDNYAAAAKEFECLISKVTGPGRRQAEYMRDLCRISAMHIQAVSHLQNAKLPLMGYKAWPVTNPMAAWPPPEKLKDLVREAQKAVALEKNYMRTYARWVKSCDEQGQLALHHQGVIEPFSKFAAALAARLVEESQADDHGKRIHGCE
ncbi:MAG: hypothetical protein WCI03_01390 [bacterium]